jgi:hypothetical protein
MHKNALLSMFFGIQSLSIQFEPLRVHGNPEKVEFKAFSGFLYYP